MKKDTKQDAQYIIDGLKKQIELVQGLLDQEETPAITAYSTVCDESTGHIMRTVSGNVLNLATTLAAGFDSDPLRRVLKLTQTMVDTID